MTADIGKAKPPLFVPNWKRILTRAHSVRAMGLVVVTEGLNVAWPYVEPYMPLSQLKLGVIGTLLAMAAIFFRLNYQPKLSGSGNEQA